MLGAGLLTEAGAVHYQYMFLDEQFADEYVVALGDVETRVGVERATGGDATHARRGIAPLHREIAADAQFLPHFR